jgi:flavodoxin
MKVLVIYHSEFGNTEKLARAIAHELEGAGWARVVAVEDFQMPDLTEVDLLVAGAPTQVHGVSRPMRDFLDGLPSGALEDIGAAAFDTRIPGIKLLTGSAANGIAKRLEKKGAYLVVEPESFLVSGGEGPLVGGEAERAIQWANELLEKVPAPVSDRIVRSVN